MNTKNVRFFLILIDTDRTFVPDKIRYLTPSVLASDASVQRFQRHDTIVK